MTAPDPTRRAALAAVRQGRVMVYRAQPQGAVEAPYLVGAAVHSSREGRPVHYVDLRSETWSCSCGTADCRHTYAVKLVTGHAA